MNNKDATKELVKETKKVEARIAEEKLKAYLKKEKIKTKRKDDSYERVREVSLKEEINLLLFQYLPNDTNIERADFLANEIYCLIVNDGVRDDY